MSNTRIVLLLTLFGCLSSVQSSLLLSDFDLPWNRIDDCKNSCDKTFDDGLVGQANSCSRGCRFYSMAEMIAKTTELDMTIAVKACTSSCQESYASDEDQRSACETGCDIMSTLKKERPQDLSITSSSFSFSFFFDDGNGLKSLQSDGNSIIPGVDQVSDPDISSLDENKVTDLETDDVLTDPALRGQTGIAFLSDIKLPIMKVKTLPVEEDDVIIQQNKVTSEQLRCWWLPALVLDMFRYLPICLLAASILLLLVLLFRMLVLLSLARRLKQAIYGELPNNGGDGDMTSSSSKYALFISECEHTDTNSDGAFVKVPPPKYDDVIVIDAESKMAAAAAAAAAATAKPTETI